MIKKLTSVAFVAAIAAVAAWNMSENKNGVELSDLALANVEALADGEEIGFAGYANVSLEWEGGMGGYLVKKCWGSGHRIC